MDQRQRYRKLSRVRDFYRQQLAVKRAALQQANAVALQHEEAAHEIELVIDRAQQQLSAAQASLVNCLQGNAWLDQLDRQRRDCQQSLANARLQVNRCREAVTEQAKQLDSLDKLLQRTRAEIEAEVAHRDQLAADERYLQTSSSIPPNQVCSKGTQP